MYGKHNQVDARALKSLLVFNSLVSGRWEAESLGGLSQADFDHAVDAGLLFKPNNVAYSHAEAVKSLLNAVSGGDAQRHASLFLASLSSGRRDYRVGLPAFAIARTFPEHEFQARPEPANPYCVVCGMTREKNTVARSDKNAQRFAVGGVLGVKPTEIAFYLECQNQLELVAPNPEDLRIFATILGIFDDAAPDDTVKKNVLRKIRKVPGFKPSADEAQLLLEALGYCGILETPERGGMLHHYVNLGTAPTKTHSSDWRYPVDFWLGKHGLNREALRFWFGRYGELAKFFE